MTTPTPRATVTERTRQNERDTTSLTPMTENTTDTTTEVLTPTTETVLYEVNDGS